MSFDDFYQRFVSSGLTFALSLYTAAFLYQWNFAGIFKPEVKPTPKVISSTNNDLGDGSSGGEAHAPCYTEKGTRCFPQNSSEASSSKTVGIKIVSKPKAEYTEQAKANSTQGKVVLRVVFTAKGEIGSISVISGLPDGLTEKAIEAAKKIKFKPAERNGVPYSVTKPVEYTFKID